MAERMLLMEARRFEAGDAVAMAASRDVAEGKKDQSSIKPGW